MEPPPPDALLRAFADILRERLMRRESVAVPGLGTFHVRHEPSRVRQEAAGERALLPPRDLVAFEPADAPS
jgi:nucleoid DNA-binding protein